MHVRHISSDSTDQEHDSYAALQRKFPKPDARSFPNRQNPIRPFAAMLSYVSVADKG